MGRRSALVRGRDRPLAHPTACRQRRWQRAALERWCARPAFCATVSERARAAPAPEGAVRPASHLQSRPAHRRSLMETKLSASVKSTPAGQAAEAILRACVHCGFCNATCPTYQLLGDELDGPRGRIYQIKQVLEGARATPLTQLHLDRCLTCRNCETTCPSGVEYGRLLDIGRAAVDAQVPRPLAAAAYRWLLREGLTRRALFGTALRLGRALRPLLPGKLRSMLAPARPAGAWPRRRHARKVLLLRSCTQGALAPSIDTATAQVLDVLGVE